MGAAFSGFLFVFIMIISVLQEKKKKKTGYMDPDTRLAKKLEAERAKDITVPQEDLLGYTVYGMKLYATYKRWMPLMYIMFGAIILVTIIAGLWPLGIPFVILIAVFKWCESISYRNAGMVIWTENYLFFLPNKGEEKRMDIDNITNIYKKGRFYHFVTASEDFKTFFGGSGIFDFLAYMKQRNYEAIRPVIEDEKTMRQIRFGYSQGM